MGYKQEFQPLSSKDKITVIIYRVGIAISTVIIVILSFRMAAVLLKFGMAVVGHSADYFIFGLYVSVGMSVFFIHLYIGKLKIYLENLYFVSLACLFILLYIGRGSLTDIVLLHKLNDLLLLMPLVGCLGFVAAKEAFCFKLIEGYLIAIIMPFYLFLVSFNLLSPRSVSYGLVLIAVLYIIFTFRKVFMPIAFDIGDKSAYQ